MSTSTSIVNITRPTAAANTVRRDSLKIGDCFKNKPNGKVFMHTGLRTAPPSAGRAVGGVVGFNSIIVDGKIKTESDGAAFSANGSRQVIPAGKATINYIAA